jgi:peptidoglycan/xylan/chitin deacetylase (PgdA/CDA1 family)
MLTSLRRTTTAALRGLGIFSLVSNSSWRQRRLLILCYHGTSLEDEHLWKPLLFISRQKLEQRFERLKRGRYSVLPLAEGLQRLRAGSLPARSVVLTFDDGTYDFYKQAYPLLMRYGFPAAVYQTTYYTAIGLPVFNLICSYMLWKSRSRGVISDGRDLSLQVPLDLRTESSRIAIVKALMEAAERENLTGPQKDEMAAKLARVLNIDYDALKAKRFVQLMNAPELQEIVKNGVDVQLHTHRHRAPEDEALFRKEIQDNRTAIQHLIGTQPVHFCYPSGEYRPEFLPWLQKELVVSATTCDAGLAARQTESLLLPRFVDHQNRSELDFESWITGVGDLLAVRRKAVRTYVTTRK